MEGAMMDFFLTQGPQICWKHTINIEKQLKLYGLEIKV